MCKCVDYVCVFVCVCVCVYVCVEIIKWAAADNALLLSGGTFQYARGTNQVGNSNSKSRKKEGGTHQGEVQAGEACE